MGVGNPDNQQGAPGLSLGPVTDWFLQNVRAVQPPLRGVLIAGGLSNLTYKITDEVGQSWILRRPPLGDLMPTAHDVRREYRVISALAGTGVPAPTAFGYCGEETLIGAPFYVMSFVPGVVPHDRETAERCLDEPARRRASESLIETLIAFQNVDPDAVGLGDIGRREGYIARQLKRWHRNYELCAAPNPGLMREIKERLEASIPEQAPATLVHGDFRPGNCICAPTGEIAAVLDWETCTLGDPLADISVLVALWAHPSTVYPIMPTAPSMAPGFWSQRQLLDAYAERSGRDLGRIAYYLAFQYWRMAVIYEEIHARNTSGAYGSPRDEPEVRESAAYYAGLARDVLDSRV